MNLRDMHYLLAVAAHLNFKRAADACHVSQPTLSMQIKKLEEYLGVRLFERTNKSVMLTDVGRRITENARHIIHEENHIHEIARTVRDPAAGEFKLGAIPTLASYVFPSYVPAISKKFPKLQLLLVEEKTEALVGQLKEGKIDAALLALPVEDSGLEAAKLFEDPFFLAVSSGHPLASKKNVALTDLAGRKLLLLNEGHCLRDQSLAVCHSHGAQEEQSFRATSLETLRLMVRSTNNEFMTLIPAIARSDHDGLLYIPFTGTNPSRQIGIVWRKASVRAAMIRQMAKSLTTAKKS